MNLRRLARLGKEAAQEKCPEQAEAFYRGYLGGFEAARGLCCQAFLEARLKYRGQLFDIAFMKTGTDLANIGEDDADSPERS